MFPSRRWVVLVLLPLLGGAPAQGGPVSVDMSVDARVRQPISRYIYGLNFAESKSLWGADVPQGITLNRMGGNRLSAYNWETNASNCGNDCDGAFPNDGYLGNPGSAPAEAVLERMYWAAQHRAAFVATVPMLGFVAADVAGPVALALPLAQRRNSRFRVSLARKESPFSQAPDTRDPAVYQDEYVSRLERARAPSPESPLFYSLDNEPDLWGSTHEVVRGNRTGKDRYVLTGYAELADTSIEYAHAIKEVAPHALVFGPAVSNWNGMANLFHNDTPDEAGRQFYLEYYLDRMRAEEERSGHRLLDVLDVHWYAEVLSSRSQSVANEWADQDAAMVQARVQSPRSLWDEGFKENSWVTRAAGGPVRLVPRLREMIASHYPGTRIAITEYFFHRGGDISGAVAQADALGVFGREGVFAAALWPQGAVWAYKGDATKTYACVLSAFRSFTDFDGAGSAFGGESLLASTSDVERTSIYASADPLRPGRMVWVLINKAETPVVAAVNVRGLALKGVAQVWRLSGSVGTCTGPGRVADVKVGGSVVNIVLPPMTVSTVVLGS
jgi:hypothetical protein